MYGRVEGVTVCYWQQPHWLWHRLCSPIYLRVFWNMLPCWKLLDFKVLNWFLVYGWLCICSQWVYECKWGQRCATQATVLMIYIFDVFISGCLCVYKNLYSSCLSLCHVCVLNCLSICLYFLIISWDFNGQHLNLICSFIWFAVLLYNSSSELCCNFYSGLVNRNSLVIKFTDIYFKHL